MKIGHTKVLSGFILFLVLLGTLLAANSSDWSRSSTAQLPLEAQINELSFAGGSLTQDPRRTGASGAAQTGGSNVYEGLTPPTGPPPVPTALAVACPPGLAWEMRAGFSDPRTASGIEGAAANLIGGKIYVSHGYRLADSNFLSIYDLASNTWTHGGPSAPNAAVVRSEMAGGVALGKHYAIGGRTGPNATNEEFDPGASTWTTKAPMALGARGGLGAASFGNKIYAIGGRSGTTFGDGTIFNRNEVYDPTTNVWTTLATLPTAVSDNYATVAFGGKVYVFGGATSPSTVIGAVQTYDIATNTWSTGAPMLTARAAAMAGVIGSQIAVFGGYNGSANLTVTEIYDPATNSWCTGPNMLAAVSEISQGMTSNDSEVYSVGTGIFGASGMIVQRLVQISGSGLQFYALPAPIRLLETRAGFTGCTMPGVPINANGTLTLPARTTCAGIPAAAAAVTGNITVVPSGPGFLTLFPSSATQPTVANSNFQANEITNNVFTVGLGASDGAFKIFSSATTHVIVDVTGYYAPPNTSGLYFHPLATPVRLLETRAGFTGCITPGAPLVGTGNANADPNLDLLLQGRSPVAAPCNSIPATAQVLVGNATSVLPNGGGYLTIYPSGGTRPTVASSNYAGNDVINGPFAVKLGADGKFKIYTFATTHLVVDILGYYSEDAVDANGAGLLFNPLPSPVRLLETRAGFAGCTMTGAPIVGNLNAATHTQMAANFCTLPASAQAVVGNVSVVNTTGAGFLTLFPANLTTAPLVATSNYPAPATFGYNRHYFVGLSPADGKFKVLTQFTTDLILDASGYFAP